MTKAKKNKSVLNVSHETQSDSVTSFITAINSAIDKRIAFESEAKTMTENNLKEFKNAKDSFTKAVNASVMIACNYDASRICSHKRSDSMRNVYAITRKDTNTIAAINKAVSLNHFTRSILLSAHKLTQRKDSLSFVDATNACDAAYKAKNEREACFVKSNNQVVSTINTQKSSSIDSLLAFNILTESRDSANVRRFTVNYKNKYSQALIDLCA